MIHIMRGLPGSGKTTFAKSLKTSPLIVSADDWHMVNGVYQYDPKQAGEAHVQCFKAFLKGVLYGTQNIVVDNTNTTLVELAPYVRVCEAYRCEYSIVYLLCPVEVAIKRNLHAVPVNTILAMNRNLLTEIVPAYWKQEVRG